MTSISDILTSASSLTDGKKLLTDVIVSPSFRKALEGFLVKNDDSCTKHSTQKLLNMFKEEYPEYDSIN